jgi:hypothetical protein
MYICAKDSQRSSTFVPVSRDIAHLISRTTKHKYTLTSGGRIKPYLPPKRKLAADRA